jgi:class 3 adenylate cyclase
MYRDARLCGSESFGGAVRINESAEDFISKPTFAWVYCLALDMIGGTEFGLRLSQEKYREWTLALPEQLRRHWNALDLSDAMLKFEGDGWLVLTPETRLVKELCCLGLVMVRRFQNDMAHMTGIDRKDIPPLRAAITAGMDLNLLLPNGHRDWAGDSARRADRASKYCKGAVVLVSEAVKQVVLRDFKLRPFSCATAEHAAKLVEEPETLYELEDLGGAIAEFEHAPLPSYVHVLRELGRSRDMVDAAAQLLATVDAGMAPDSPEKSAAVRGVANLGSVDAEALRRIVIPPRAVAFNVAIGAAPDYQTSLQWFERMEAAGVIPNVVTFNTLVARAPDYQTSLQWFERMEAAAVIPDVVTFSTLFAKPLDDHDPQALIEWYLRRQYHPEGPIEALLANLRRSGNVDAMTTVLLHYPHLSAARKIMRELREEILDRLLTAYTVAPNEPNPPYAVGVCLVELGRASDAVPYLKHALRLAVAGPRKNHLRELLKRITQ